MKNLTYLTTIRGIVFFLVIVLFTNCKKEPVSTDALQPLSNEAMMRPGMESLAQSGLSQTRTATLFNYNLEGSLVHNYSGNSKASDVAFDDGVYAKTRKLGGHSGSLLVLEGFGFDIPTTATIDNIIVKARRFKTGSGTVREGRVRLVRNRNRLPDWWEEYGFRWEDPTHSIYFPAAEAEVSYSQSGNGSDFGGYQWTPGMINDLYFGVLFTTLNPEKGSVVINYDYVDITVQYSIP